METWNLFSTHDLLVAVIGIVGILSVFIVLGSASGKVNKREVTMKEFYSNLRRREAEAEAKRLDDESNYDTSSK